MKVNLSDYKMIKEAEDIKKFLESIGFTVEVSPMFLYVFNGKTHIATLKPKECNMKDLILKSYNGGFVDGQEKLKKDLKKLLGVKE